MDKHGIIVTNYHVVPSGNEPNKAIFVQTRDGKVMKAFVVGCDRRTDIAVLTVSEDTTLTPITPAKTNLILAILHLLSAILTT